MIAKRNSTTRKIRNADGSIRFQPSPAQVIEAASMKSTNFGSHQVCVNGFTRRIIRGKEQIRRANIASQA